MENDNNIALRAVTRAAALSIAGNIMLAAMKATAGWATGSAALISDAAHSAADISSGVIVAVGAKVSARKADSNYPYGYERFECIAAMILAFALLLTGTLIGWNAIQDLYNGSSGEAPGVLALAAVSASIVVKECLFRYVWFFAQKYESDSLKAEAWHHRSDIFCSLGVFAGVAGARMGWYWMDSVAGLLICGLIVGAACRIFADAIRKMMDHSCSAETEEALRRCAKEQMGVLFVKRLRTREFGSRIYVEMEICVDAGLRLIESEQISKEVHDAVEAQFPQVKHVIVCAKPKTENHLLELP